MAKTLIKGGFVLSMDPKVGNVDGGDVLIDSERIAEIGRDLDTAGARVIDASRMIVMPGLINTHMHTWQTGVRGISGDWSLLTYFRYMHSGMAASFRPEDLYIGTLVGALNQMNMGVTTLFDWLHNNPTPDHTDGGLDGLMESGIRAVFGHGSPKHEPKEGAPHFSEVPHPASEIKRLRTGRLSADDALVTLAMCILGPHISTWEVTRQDLRLAAEYGLIASAHMDAGYHRVVPDGVHRMHGEGLIDERFNVVHGNDLSDEEIKILVDDGASFSTTTEAEMHFAFGYPITGRVIRAGGRPSIGVDSETNISGDMFAAMRIALQMQRAIDHGPVVTEENPVIDLTVASSQALEWATVNGAKALNMADKIGSLTPGKLADVITIRMDDLNLFPVNDPLQSVVLQANGSNVDTVLIGGKMVKEAGRLLFPDLAKKKEQLAESGARLIANYPIDYKLN